MTEGRFAAPSEASSLDMDSMVNHLLVIKVTEFVPEVTTVYGPKEAIRATIHDISTSETHEDTLLFGGFLIGSLKNRVGQEVLAVLYQGAASKPGQNPPWMLTKDASANPQYVAAAVAYLDAYAAKQFKAPAAPVAPVAPVPAAAPVAVAPVAAPVAAAPAAVLPGAAPVVPPMPADHLMAPQAAVAAIPGFDPASMTPEAQAAMAQFFASQVPAAPQA